MLTAIRHTFSLASVLMGISLFASAPARAGIPVIDAANLAQSIQQVISWGQQLRGMVNQYEQLVSTYDSLTGPRGMQSLMPVSLAERNYLPTTTQELLGVMNGTSLTYAPLAAQVQSSIQSNAILNAQQVAALTPQEQIYLTQSRRSAATLGALSQQTQTTTSTNFGSLQRLITALGGTTDTKASADLAARIQSEQVMTQTNQIKTEALYHAIQAQQLQNEQIAREMVLQSLGTMASQPVITW